MAFANQLVLIAVIIFTLAIVAYSTLVKNTKFTTVKIGNATVNAEIADNSLKRMMGLMFRSSLGENDGMLFAFNSENYYTFWMMNTSIPLDIIWINSTK